MRTSMRSVLLSSLLASPACYHEGEFGYLQLELDPIVDPLTEFRSGDQILSGSMICPQIVMAGAEWIDDRAQFRACFSETVTGPGQLDADGCLHFGGSASKSDDHGPRKLIWELTPSECGERVERVRFAIVDNDNAHLRLDFDEWRLRALALARDPRLGLEIVGLAPGRDLADLLDPHDTARRVFAGQTAVPLMRLSNPKGVVYWTAPEVRLDVVGPGLHMIAPVADHGELVGPGELAVRLDPGAVGHVRATLPSGDTLTSPRLIAVTISDAASLDLIRVDAHLIVDVRDAEGHRLHAAPIEWSVIDGALAIIPGTLSNHAKTRDYASFETRCQPAPEHRPQQRHATVRARLGELEDTVVVEWLASPRSTTARAFAVPDSCTFAETEAETDPGCGCTLERTPPTVPTLATLPLLALLRRRRTHDRRQ